MSEFMFALIRGNAAKPTRKEARKMESIAKAEGAHGFVEVNIKPGSSVGINSGAYQGWFTGPNYGSPFDARLAERVKSRIAAEVRNFWG